jgi:hypothetical protein
MRPVPAVCLGLILLFLSGPLLIAAHYVEIRTRIANVRNAPRRGAGIVAKANRNDVFQLEDEKGNWYAIHLFSGATRYVHKSVARPVAFTPDLPQDSSVRRDIFKAWMQAHQKANDEADRTRPPDRNLKRNLSLKNLLNDRYKLKVFHDFRLPPAVYRRIILEGNRRGW